MNQPVFMFGAGFNADANIEVGPIDPITICGREIPAAYPLVSDLSRICFDLASPPAGRSIEDLFQEAYRSNDLTPGRRLAENLMYADYSLASKLIYSPNCYSRFFERFKESSFITFIYDSLVELFLLHHRVWFPHDGYGVPVIADTPPKTEQISTSLVLHLHGSLCIYPTKFIFEKNSVNGIAWLKNFRPKFMFDPKSIGDLFSPFRGVVQQLDYTEPENRIIAPVPDKSEGLTKEFIDVMYTRAGNLLRSSAAPLVIIGYSFNRHDKISYASLLSAVEARSGSILVVAPDAASIKSRISSTFPGIKFEAVAYTFRSWVEGSFPGL